MPHNPHDATADADRNTPGSIDALRRPRIADLMLLTLSVSVFLALCRYAFTSDVNFVLLPLNRFELLSYGIGVACCWTGVFGRVRVAAARAMPLSRWQPGEVVCLIEGAYYAIVAGMGAGLRLWLLGGNESMPDGVESSLSLVQLSTLYALPPVLLCVGYVMLARSADSVVWRRAAVAKAIAHGATPIALVTLVATSEDLLGIGVSLALILCFVVPTALIGVAAWRDRSTPGRHWTHWLGVFAFGVIHAARLSVEVRALLLLVG